MKRRKRGTISKRIGQKQSSTAKGQMKGSAIFLWALGFVAVGGGGYLIYDRLKTNRVNLLTEGQEKDTIIINNNLPASSGSTSYTVQKTSTTGNDSFPLRQGSRGARVLQLQRALDSLLGEGTMQKSYGGIDGIFGPLTAAALRKAGFPEVVNEKTFMTITVGSVPNGVIVHNPSELALVLYRAAQSKLLYQVLALLKQIKSVGDYSTVNEAYKKLGLISKTIVTDLLDFAFKNDESAKEQIRAEFLRIGLKVDESGRWSLQGFRLYSDLITLRDTVLTDSMNNKIPVKRNTILGDEVQIANGLTYFRSIDNSILSVPTQDVKYT